MDYVIKYTEVETTEIPLKKNNLIQGENQAN